MAQAHIDLGRAFVPWAYDCARCEEDPGRKVLLGHDGPPAGMWREHLITGEPLKRCPLRDVLEAPSESRALVDRMRLTHYPMFRRGHLLEPGGAADQPALYTDFMLALDYYEQAVERRFQAQAVCEPDGGRED